MNIIQFIKLLKRNLVLLVTVPFLMAGIVWFLTQDQVKKYKSDSIIYTGIADGLSMEQLGRSKVDYYGSKIEYDNISNIFKARETHKEVALKLLAQGLSLNSWDPRFIGRSSFIKLHDYIPQFIKNLVIKKDTVNFEKLLANSPMVLNDTIGLRNKKLIYSNIFHNVERGESLLTLSKSFNVPVSSLMEWNNLTSASLSTNQRLIVRKVQKVVYNSDIISRDTIDLYVPDTTFFIKTKIDSVSFEQTVKNFIAYTDANDTNYLYKLLNSRNPYYSYYAISEGKASRVQGSDLMKITYTSPDPGITRQTLNFLIGSFQKHYKKLKENQSDIIVSYFQKQVNESSVALIAAENKLLNFNQDNNIINYYEQTRHISSQKEQLDKAYYDEKMKFNASESVIKHIESQLDNLRGITAINQSVLQQRNAIASLSYKIAINELNDNKDPEAVNEIVRLRDSVEVLKMEISRSLDSTFRLQYTAEGINQDKLLTSWLNKTIEYEESKATLAALYERKKEFQRTYEIFAPLGAKLTRIEREISIYEQQYLQHLRSLNQAKLKQQNLEFKSNIKIIDPPYLPLKPEASKKILFIIAAWIVGFIMVLFSILALEYLDKTLKMPVRAEKFVGLKPITAYPVLRSPKKSINYDYLRKRSIQLLHQGIFEQLNNNFENMNSPIKILFFSTQEIEGKSLMIDEYTKLLRSLGNQVLMMSYISTQSNPKISHNIESHTDNINYRADDQFLNKNSVDDLINSDLSLNKSDYDFITIEIPSIVRRPYSQKLIQDIDFAALIVRSNRTWQNSDKLSLEQLMNTLKSKPLFVLNGINVDYMQEFIGEIPKRRSKIRRIFKKLITFQVFERYHIKK